MPATLESAAGRRPQWVVLNELINYLPDGKQVFCLIARRAWKRIGEEHPAFRQIARGNNDIARLEIPVRPGARLLQFDEPANDAVDDVG